MELVHVEYHHDPDAWWAESPDVPGWTATAETLPELRALAEEGVRFALERDDVVLAENFGYALSGRAAIVFDFVADRVVVSPALSHAGPGSGRAHWLTPSA